MAQTYLTGTVPVRPGVYFRRTADGVTVQPAINGVLAVLYHSNWGALNKVFDIDQTMINNLEDYVGDAAQVIREGLIGGATTVRAVRVGTGGKESSVKLKNTAATPANCVELSARYVGNREFDVTIKTNSITGKRQVMILDGDNLFEQVEFEPGGNEAEKMVNAFANNRFFVAKKLVDGTLADVAQAVTMTGGTDPTVNAAAYIKGTEILERYRWNVIVADSDDSDIQSKIYDFVKQSYETGHLGMCVIAGKSSQTLEDRMSTAKSINDEKVVYVLNGWIGNDGTVYEGYPAAARIGGMIAGSESNTSVAHLVIQNALELIEPLTNGEIIKAEESGCLVVSLNEDDQVILDNAINTLITPGNNMDEGWKKIRRTKTRFELIYRVNRTCERLIGRLTNNTNGRATILAAMQGIINEMIGENKLFAGSYAAEDEVHRPEGDKAYFVLYISDIDSMEKIFINYNFTYGNRFAVA